MPGNKLQGRIILCMFLAATAYALFAAYVNFVFLPKVAVPKIYNYLNSDALSPVRISIEKMTFHPFKGFFMHNLRIEGPVVLRDDQILYAKLVDVDLSLAPMLWKRIYIKRLNIVEADLAIGRDITGEWNLRYLKNLPFLIGKGRFDVVVDSVRLLRCNAAYIDNYKKDNVLERNFRNVNIDINRYAGVMYRLTLLGNSAQREKESVRLSLDYNSINGDIRGLADLTTTYIGDYWDYYLDELFKPWRMTCKRASMHTSFSHKADIWKFNGRYDISNAVLSYGDAAIMADAVAGHEMTYVKGSPGNIESHVRASLKDVSTSLGRHILLEKGECNIVIMKDEIDIKDISGAVCGWPVALKGKFVFGDKRRLVLGGKIADVRHNFCLDIPAYDHGSAYWNFSRDDSYLKIHADIPDLKQLLFNLRVKGDIDTHDLAGLLKVDEEKLGGTIDFSGDLTGEADEPRTLQGKLSVAVRGFSVLNLQPTSFDFNMEVKDGVFHGLTPEADFYKGKVSTELLMDLKRWGAQVRIANLDLAEFSKLHPKLESTAGLLSGRLTFVSDIKDFLGTVRGGGYIKLKKCDLRRTPLFSSVNDGIKNIAGGMEMPLFEKAEVYFSVADRNLDLDRAFFESPEVDINFLGRITFDGMFNLTLGSRLLSSDFVMKIMVPPALAFDMMKDVIEVDVTGKWPKLKSSSRVEPVAWFDEFFSFLFRPGPAKYELGKLWKG